MNNNEKCCGTCRYNKPSWETGKLTGYSCDNDESDYYGVSTFMMILVKNTKRNR